MTDTEKPASWWGVWWVAVRPFAYTTSVLPVVLGTALAWGGGSPVLWIRFALALVGVVCFHTAANLLNDCFDFRRGLDDTVHPGSGAVVRGWLTDRQVERAAWLCLGIGSACGFLLAWRAGWPVLAVGLLGAAVALGYTREGLCLKYAGLGDFAILTAFGVLPVFGSYWVQAEQFSWTPVFWSVPMVAYAVGILTANNWRDIAGDAVKQCRTLAARLGSRGARGYYQALMLGPFVLVAGGLVVGRWAAQAPIPSLVLLVFLALPLALRLAFRNWPAEPGEFAMLDARTAQLHLLFGSLLIAGFLLGGVGRP